jgi:UDP-3-O-[3-hydroxymyristoyl] glucosamine N-acyltransferase
VFDAAAHRKVPQVGHVILHDDVELGRQRHHRPRSPRRHGHRTGTKIDNLVQIAHNVGIGEHCTSWSPGWHRGQYQNWQLRHPRRPGRRCGHLRIADKVTIAAQSGVMNHIPEGQKWMGSPAQPDRVTKRQLLAVERLPELLRRVQELERRLGTEEKPV